MKYAKTFENGLNQVALSVTSILWLGVNLIKRYFMKDEHLIIGVYILFIIFSIISLFQPNYRHVLFCFLLFYDVSCLMYIQNKNKKMKLKNNQKK